MILKIQISCKQGYFYQNIMQTHDYCEEKVSLERNFEGIKTHLFAKSSSHFSLCATERIHERSHISLAVAFLISTWLVDHTIFIVLRIHFKRWIMGNGLLNADLRLRVAIESTNKACWFVSERDSNIVNSVL